MKKERLVEFWNPMWRVSFRGDTTALWTTNSTSFRALAVPCPCAPIRNNWGESTVDAQLEVSPDWPPGDKTARGALRSQAARKEVTASRRRGRKRMCLMGGSQT